jgi:hypothetical protein
MDSLLSRPYCSSCVQPRDRHFYFKKPDLGEAGGLFKTCLTCREKALRSLNKKRKPLQELDPNLIVENLHRNYWYVTQSAKIEERKESL